MERWCGDDLPPTSLRICPISGDDFEKKIDTLTVKKLVVFSLNGKTYCQFRGLFIIWTAIDNIKDKFHICFKNITHKLFKRVTIKLHYRQANLNKYRVRNPTPNSGLRLQKLLRRFIAALMPNVLRQMELST